MKSLCGLLRLLTIAASLIGVFESFGQQPGTKRWDFTLSGAPIFSPALGLDGTILISSEDRNKNLYELCAVNPNGLKKWATQFSAAISSSPSIGPSGTIFVGSEDKNLHAVSPSGSILWSFATGGEIDGELAIGSDGTVYCYSRDGNLYAVSPSGAKKWQFLISDESSKRGDLITIGRDQTIFAVRGEGPPPVGVPVLFALSPQGEMKWRVELSRATFGISALSCILDENDAFFFMIEAAGSRSVSYLNPKDFPIAAGAFYPFGTLHAPDIPTFSSMPNIGAAGTFIGASGSVLVSEFPSRAKKWAVILEGGGANLSTQPAIAADGLAYVGSENGKLYAVDGSGALNWSFQSDGPISSHPVVATDGTVYFASADRKLYAVVGKAGLAKTAWPMYRRDPQHTANAGFSPSTAPPSGTPAQLRLNMYAGITVEGTVGQKYQIQYSFDATQTNGWTNLVTILLDKPTFLFFDADSTNSPKRFYRSVSVP